MLDERTPTKSARGKHTESGRILPNARCEPCSEAASGEHPASLYFHFATDSTAGLNSGSANHPPPPGPHTHQQDLPGRTPCPSLAHTLKALCISQATTQGLGTWVP